MGDIVWVPFPFVETPRMRDRPAVVVSRSLAADDADLLWVLMITSAANGGWPDDVSLIERHAECGLAVPCVIRTTKISTVEARRGRLIGSLPNDLLREIREKIAQHLAL